VPRNELTNYEFPAGNAHLLKSLLVEKAVAGD
jgi:hypothetical protein